MDSSDQLRRLHEAGFALETFERYPRHVGAIRDNCIALIEVTPVGLRLTGAPGWRMGEVMGVLVQQGDYQVFQAKSETVEATSDRVAALRQFRDDLERLLTPAA
jgi:hypothetical protein